jgi:two-component system, chemotaxis family, sensor kinase CheA
MSDLDWGGSEFAQFRDTYFAECEQMLADLEERLGRLRSEPGNREELNAVFRAVHSIKAGAGAFNLTRLVRFSHGCEALLDGLREGRIAADERVSRLLVRAADVLAELVEAARQERSVADDLGADIAAELAAVMAGAGASVEGAAAPAVPSPAALPKETPQHFRITFRPHAELFRHANEPLLLIRDLKRLGDLTVWCDTSALPALSELDPENAYLSWAFHLATVHPATAISEVFEFVADDCDLVIACAENVSETAAGPARPPSEAVPTPASSAPAAADASEMAQPDATVVEAPAVPSPSGGSTGRSAGVSSIRVELARVDRLVNMVGELVISQAMLAQQIADQRDRTGDAWRQGQEDVALRTRELQECVMAIRMQPVKSLFARMPRLVRDIAGRLDKQVRLVMVGEQTEVDTTIIEELADPLIHMIRNAIDHGIEDPATRLANGKPAEGMVEISATHRGGNILIQVLDDGAGIDRERLLRKAVEKGIVPADADLSEDAIDDLIFAPGFSTAERITDVSGRGVGMDVVRSNINNLSGRIQVQSSPGRGTRFTLILPLTLAMLDGMVVAVGREKYILPLTSIIESIRPERHQLRSLGGAQVVSIRGEFIRLIHLSAIFAVPDAVVDPSQGLVVLVETGDGSKIGIVVDELIGQQQVVIKSLQDNFEPVAGISGATILGNGRVALILDVEQLAGMALQRAPGRGTAIRAGTAAPPGAGTHRAHAEAARAVAQENA